MVQGQRQRSESREIGMSLRPPDKVRKLQRTLHAKAKESPDYRFYALYDKVNREDILLHAYQSCKANGGAAGVDGETFEDIESYGRERWLGELSEAVRSKSYRVSPIRRVYIPKPNGKQRPLGIPTVKDRVVQTATVLVISPIIRGGPASAAVCLPSQEERARCCKGRAHSGEPWPHAGDRRRLERLL